MYSTHDGNGRSPPHDNERLTGPKRRPTGCRLGLKYFNGEFTMEMAAATAEAAGARDAKLRLAARYFFYNFFFLIY